MSCKDTYQNRMMSEITRYCMFKTKEEEFDDTYFPVGLSFGVDSDCRADAVLQNNLSQFEWVTRNKIYPDYWARNINGENCLTKGEIDFLRRKGCRIAAFYYFNSEKKTAEQGKAAAEAAAKTAVELDIPLLKAIFLNIGSDEDVTAEFLRSYAVYLMREGYTPGFRANTDSSYSNSSGAFNRAYSIGIHNEPDVFEKCLIWAVTPIMEEYNRMITTHLIHPDVWQPFAPSGTTRDKIAVWRYGEKCHPIKDENNADTCFNLNLVKNKRIILDRMF